MSLGLVDLSLFGECKNPEVFVVDSSSQLAIQILSLEGRNVKEEECWTRRQGSVQQCCWYIQRKGKECCPHKDIFQMKILTFDFISGTQTVTVLRNQDDSEQAITANRDFDVELVDINKTQCATGEPTDEARSHPRQRSGRYPWDGLKIVRGLD